MSDADQEVDQVEGEEMSLEDSLTEAWAAHESEGAEPQEAAPEADEEAVDENVPRGTQEPAEQDDPLAEPPRGLTAAQRAKWDETPKEIREAIHKRSQDYSNGIKQYAQAAKQGEALNKAMQPYQQLFAMNQVEPPQLVGQLLQTASILQMGTPQQKASLVANMVKQFGVDINALDHALVGEAPPKEMQEQDRLEQLLQQRLSPYQQELEQFRREREMREQQEHQKIAQDIDQFRANPEYKYYEDVRLDMADWLDMAAKRGQQMTLEEAYHRACQAHPVISKQMQTQQAAQMTQRKRAASSSVYGTPAAPAGNDTAASLRGALEQAFETAGRM